MINSLYRITKFKFIFLALAVCQGCVLNSQELLGGEALPLPPVFNPADKSLIDAQRDLSPSKKSLEAVKTKFKNGDIVFIRSTSSQAKALEEVTSSRWTHVGILFRVKLGATAKLLEADSKEGEWVVFEAGPTVRFNPVDRFVGKKEFAVLRLKETLSHPQVKELFKVSLSRLKKPYDVYFLLSHNDKYKDDPDYCSELVWYVYAKALKIVIGYRTLLASKSLEGPEAKKLIRERFSRRSAPMSLENWQKKYVIPPESQFVSPLLIRVDAL